MKYVKDLDEARNLVHEVFITIWEKFDSLPSDTNYRSYLYTAVRNRCLNHLRDTKKHLSIEKAEHKMTEETSSMETAELEREIELAINSLPEKCRMVFEFSRMEGLKYGEIAEKMGISVKTVEAQMSKALTVLRAHLSEFMSLIFIVLGL
jgi:RNA polymerase sigma-70 factor (ECF subfamily)